MWRSWSPLELAFGIAIGGSVIAVAVPAFFQNLEASKLSEPVDGLERIVAGAVAYSEGRPAELSYPPSVGLTPEEVPRGVLSDPQPEVWDHLTWKSLRFEMDRPHAFSYRFDSFFDAANGVSRFVATAHGDLDGDGTFSTFQVRGERIGTAPARALPGLYVDREVE